MIDITYVATVDDLPELVKLWLYVLLPTLRTMVPPFSIGPGPVALGEKRFRVDAPDFGTIVITGAAPTVTASAPATMPAATAATVASTTPKLTAEQTKALQAQASALASGDATAIKAANIAVGRADTIATFSTIAARPGQSPDVAAAATAYAAALTADDATALAVASKQLDLANVKARLAG